MSDTLSAAYRKFITSFFLKAEIESASFWARTNYVRPQEGLCKCLRLGRFESLENLEEQGDAVAVDYVIEKY